MSLTDRARAEAERRFPNETWHDMYGLSYPRDALVEARRGGFKVGAQWAVEQMPTREQIAETIQRALGCKKTFDELTYTDYCAEHQFGWLSDTNLCPSAEQTADAVLRLLSND